MEFLRTFCALFGMGWCVGVFGFGRVHGGWFWGFGEGANVGCKWDRWCRCGDKDIHKFFGGILPL